jgi:hypothetical protein
VRWAEGLSCHLCPPPPPLSPFVSGHTFANVAEAVRYREQSRIKCIGLTICPHLPPPLPSPSLLPSPYLSGHTSANVAGAVRCSEQSRTKYSGLTICPVTPPPRDPAPYLSGHTSANVGEAVRYSEESRTKCIGLTIETRPDYCLGPHLSDMLSYGCTRLEIGLQVSWTAIFLQLGDSQLDKLPAQLRLRASRKWPAGKVACYLFPAAFWSACSHRVCKSNSYRVAPSQYRRSVAWALRHTTEKSST